MAQIVTLPVQFYSSEVVPYTPAPGVAMNMEMRSVTAYNFEWVVEHIGNLLQRFPIIVVDTEYPGAVHRPRDGKRECELTPDEQYALVKANVDDLPIVQLGLTLCDEQGNLPRGLDVWGRPVVLAWQVYFSDFDPRRDRQAPESVAFLRSQGLDFDQARAHGVSSAAFAAKLLSVLRPAARRDRRRPLTWAAFGGAYDFAFLVKMFTGGAPLPRTREEFRWLVRALLGGRVFDARYMAENCGLVDLRGHGLRGMAEVLGVPRLEAPCIAGPKSLTACLIYTSLRIRLLQQLHRHEGKIDGLDEGHKDDMKLGSF